MGLTAKGYPYPDVTDPPDGPAQIGALAQVVDDNPGILIASYAEINALTGAQVWEGRQVYQTDTGTNRPRQGVYTHNGVEWRLPWNQPWGVLAVASLTTNQTGNGTETDIGGLSITQTFVANRWVKATLSGRLVQNALGTPVFYVYDGVSHTVDSPGPLSATDTAAFFGAYLFSPAAGSLTVKARVSSAAGTVDVFASSTTPARLFLEDIGPNGAAV